jgi:hypothetical protein
MMLLLSDGMLILILSMPENITAIMGYIIDLTIVMNGLSTKDVPKAGVKEVLDVRVKPRHVAVLMDLTASPAFGSAEGPHCQLIYGKAERPKGDKTGGINAQGADWDGYARETETEAERYCLNILGHGGRQYPVMSRSGVLELFDYLFQRSLVCGRPDFLDFAQTMEAAIDRVSFLK